MPHLFLARGRNQRIIQPGNLELLTGSSLQISLKPPSLPPLPFRPRFDEPHHPETESKFN